MSKKCSKCGEIKNLDCFNKSKSMASGYASACRECLYPGSEARGIERARIKALRAEGKLICGRCKEEKPLAEFAALIPERPGWRPANCLVCQREWAKEYRDSNREKVKSAGTRQRKIRKDSDPEAFALADRRRYLWYMYKITLEDYEEMREKQGGKCGICKRPDSEFDRKMAVDHDHNCCPVKTKACGNCNRGLLCTRCNVNLGFFETNETEIRAWLSSESVVTE